MTGTVGLFNLDGRPATAVDLERLAAASRRPGKDGQRFWVCSSFGLGCQFAHPTPDSIADEQPFVSSRGVSVVLDGRIDESLEAPSSSSQDEACAPHDVAGILRAYERSGERFAAHLNGDFAVAVVDPGQRRLLLARDVMGSRPLHYTRAGRTLLFASEIKSLLAFPGVSAAPDDDALADIVLDRWVDGDCTGFKGIHSVPPGHTVIVTPDALSVQRHWAFAPERVVRYRRPDEYSDHFRSLFEQAVRRRMRTARAVAVAVSGGVDSSAVFCQALALSTGGRARATVHGISATFAQGGLSDEREFLDVLDMACDRRIIRLPLASVSLMSHAEVYIEQTEMPALTWTPQNQLLDEAQRLGCSVVLDGYFGDQVLFPRSYLIDMARRGHWLRARRDLNEFPAWMTDSPEGYVREFWSRLFRSMVPQPIFQAAKKRAAQRRAKRYPAWYRKTFVRRVIERQLARVRAAPPSAGAHAMEYCQHVTAGHYLLQVQRMRAQAMTRGLEAAHPFRDRDLVAFLMAVPGEVVNWGGVPKGIARRGLGGILPAPIRDRRWKADFTMETNQATLNDEAVITRLLTRSCAAVAAGFADSSTIEPALLACKTAMSDNNSADAGWDLSQLVALELWLRRFCSAEPPCTTS